MELSKVKLSEVYEFLSENNISLMLGGANVHLHKLQEWFKDYYENENSAYFDSWILNLFGDMSFINTLLFRNIEDIKDTEKWNDTLKNQCVSFLQSQLNSVCFVHEYELEKLYESILLTYNPIENYSMTESGTDTTVGTIESAGSNTTANTTDVTENIGEQHSTTTDANNTTVTDNLGQTKTTNTNSEINNTTDNLGNTSTTEETTKEHPTKTLTKELKTSPYDTSSYFNKEYETETETYSNYDEEQKTTNTTNVVNTSNNEKSSSNEVTTDSIVNTSTNEASTTSEVNTDSATNTIKTETSNSSEFTNNENNNATTTHSFTRSGNIGVTTTQEMLISEREVAVFSLFQHFWELFVKDNMILLDDNADWNDCIFG